MDGKPENYNFGDGRIVYSDSVPPRPQFRLTDHLGNTVVFFEDKNLNGCITTEADTSGLAVEVLQRLWYYPFGLQMENLSTWETAPGQAYRYNGKERDTLSGWYEYGARWYDAGIGRFTGVDPIADQFPWVSVFNYAENEPVGHIDLWGLQKYSVIDNNGQERRRGDYSDKNTGTQIRSTIDAISGAENVKISDVTFKDVGPKEFSTTDGWGGERSIFHEMEYAYCGADECGNSVEGTGNIMVPVTSFQTGSSLGDVVMGGMMSYGFRALGKGFFINSATKGVTNLVPEGKLANHLFKGSGKLADNSANRTLIQKIANGNPLGVDAYGKSWYMGVDGTGKSVYTYTQNGVVKGAGYATMTPAEMIAKYGLK